MSNSTNKSIESSDKWFNWIEDAITKNYFEYYEYENFSNIQEIGSGRFGKVYSVNWKSSHEYLLALKSFFNFNNITVKEIINEVIVIDTNLQYI